MSFRDRWAPKPNHWQRCPTLVLALISMRHMQRSSGAFHYIESTLMGFYSDWPKSWPTAEYLAWAVPFSGMVSGGMGSTDIRNWRLWVCESCDHRRLPSGLLGAPILERREW